MAKSRGFVSDRHNLSKRIARKNHILAIAIDEYSNGQRPLSYPVSDCDRLIDILTERYDFDPRQVTRLYNENATKELLRDELYELPNKLGPNDNLLLLFAGHGFYDEHIDEGYWIPVDAPRLKKQTEAEDIFFSFQRIVKYLNKAGAHHIVFMIDSCFGGKFGQVTMKVPDSDAANMNHPESKPSRWLLSSGRIEVVLDQSPFAKTVHEILSNNTQPTILLNSLYEGIRQRTEGKFDQTAFCASIVPGEARGGEFAFRLRENLIGKKSLAPTPSINANHLRERLLQGSRDYLEFLKQGRFAKLQFEKILLPDAQAELLDVEVKLEDNQTPLKQAMEQLWKQDGNPNTLICGEGGMGKTISCVRLWEELLEGKGDETPIPIFLPLNEYNATTVDERQRKNYLYQFIAREYLDDSRLTSELEDALKQLLKKQEECPTVMLLLDGFNEITIENNHLMVELAEFKRRAKGVQIAVTSRYEMRNYVWTQGFQRLDLLNLTESQILGYLNRNEVDLPYSDEVKQLLGNPMMLTLYVGSSQLNNQFKDDLRFDFRSNVSSKGELLHNFFEGQLAKYVLDNTNSPSLEKEFLWQSFLIRHLIPFLAYRMVEEGQFFIHGRKRLNPTFNIKSVVEETYSYLDEFDFTDQYEAFEGRRKWLGFGIAKKDYDSIEDRNQRIRRYLIQKLYVLIEEGETLRFLHQNFRDYFASVHVQRDMKRIITRNINLSVEKKTFPKTLQKGPLDFYVRQILGELEGEHTNKILWNIEDKKWRWSQSQFFLKNNLSKLLAQCRGVFDPSILGFTLWNIITIWKEQRGELSGADLSSLYFQGISLNNLKLSRPGLTARLSKARLTEKNLFHQGHSQRIVEAVFSPNGLFILTGSHDRTAKVWKKSSGQCMLTLTGHSSYIMSVVYRPDGQCILTGSWDKTAKIWDTQSGECLMTLKGHSRGINAVAYHPDGQNILTGSRDHTAKVWDAQSGECLMTLKGHSGSITDISYSPDGRQILTGSCDKTAKIWDTHNGRCIMNLEGHSDEVISAVYHPNGLHVLTTSMDNTAKVWDLKNGQCHMTLGDNSKKAMIRRAVYNHDGRHILIGLGNTSKVWDIENCQYLMTLEGHLNGIMSMDYHPHEQFVLTASLDQTVKVWDLENGRCVLTLEGYYGYINSVAYSPDGQRILIGSEDRTAKIWDTQSGQCLIIFDRHPYRVTSVAFHPRNHSVLTGSLDQTVKIWDEGSGRCLLILEGHSGGVISAVYHPDGQYILTGSWDKTAKIWDIENGQYLLSLEGHSGMLTSVAYSPDGQRILTGSVDRTAKVWDTQSGQCVMTIECHDISIRSVVFSPDGKRALTGSWDLNDKTAKIWNTHNGRCIMNLEGHSGRITSVAYSPDGQRILTGSEDQTAKVWDAQSGECLMTLKGHSGSITDISYSPDGRQILTGSSDTTTKIWDTETGGCNMEIYNIPGLLIQGCDFRTLHPDSGLSEKNIQFLRQYGGIFNDEDEKRGQALMERHEMG